MNTIKTPQNLSSQDRIQGNGRHVYKWIDGWAKIPPNIQLGYTHSVCEDSQGRILVHNTGPAAVAIFAADGSFIGSWGEELSVGAHGMQYSRESTGEFLYFANNDQHLIAKTTLDGVYLWKMGAPMESGLYKNANEFQPTNIAIAPNGDFYVADGYGLHWIHQYSPNAKYIRSFGGPGEAPHQMKNPHGIWIDTRHSEPRVLIADRHHCRLQHFTLVGDFIEVVSTNADLPHPDHFDQRDGDLLIPDLFGHITILDRDNQLVACLFANPGIEQAEGWPNLPPEQIVPVKFNSPHMACWDSAGNIFVVEWIATGRIIKLQRQATIG